MLLRSIKLSRGFWSILYLLLFLLPALQATAAPAAVAALGRLEPLHGIVRVTAPVSPEATAGMVLGKLLVEAGDDVVAGQLIAITETAPLLASLRAEADSERLLAEHRAAAAVGSADAECVRADVFQREADRRTQLLSRELSSVEESERAVGEANFRAAVCRAARLQAEASRAEIAVSRAKVARIETALERAHVRAPMAGRVLEVTTRPGELIGRDGIIELGQVDRMYAIAEVYETDIGRVARGQRAVVSSRALIEPLEGRVEHVRLQVRKHDQLGTDPAARKDARIVEVEILLDDSRPVAGLSHLQVEVLIEP